MSAHSRAYLPSPPSKKLYTYTPVNHTSTTPEPHRPPPRKHQANACAYIRARLWAGTTWCSGQEHSWTLEKCARALIDDAVHAKGCQDNTSAMIIQFHHPDQDPSPRVRVQMGA